MVMDGYRDEVVVSKPPAATALSNDEERCVDNRSNGFSCSFSAIKERGLLCVTSGNTCLGSHLVKKLLSRGYFIRVTIQNQEDFEDMKELIKQEEMNLLESVVVAKMGDLDSLCEAFRGCHAIFHTSSFTDPHGVAGYTERTAFLETEAAKNVIEACARAAYVKRCIFTSSLLASIWNINNADRIVDESCWSNEAFCRENKLWLALGKTTAEKAAWRKSRELKVKLITICPALLMAPSFPNAHIETSLPYLKGSTTRTSGSSTTAAPNPTSLRWDRQTIQFLINAWVFAVAVLAIIPFVPRNLSNRAYGLAFMGFACSSLYSVYSLYGKPRAWNLQAVQVWFQSVIATKDFIYFIYCLTFVTSRLYLKFALLPILCWALEHVAKFLRRNFSRSSLYRKYLEEPCVWIESNTTTLSILSSQAEIGLGFLLILSLFSSQRNIILTFMYSQLLKLMYHAPVTGGYHQSVWAKIGRTVNPPIHRYAPFLNTPISAVQRWWFR